MALNDDEQREARQRAADRVASYLDRREKIDAVDRPEGDTSQLVIDASIGSTTLLASDLRLLVQAAPPLPPKWSAPLADPLVRLVLSQGLCVLATRSEQRAAREAAKIPGAVMHTIGVQP